MKALILTIAVALTALSACSQRSTKYRTYSDTTGRYLIKYYVVDGSAFVPSTYPAGDVHYDADVTVFALIGEELVKIGRTFSGIYTPNQCFEDDPSYYVTRAKKLQHENQLRRLVADTTQKVGYK